jgi:plasmid stabilization system protein ParE
VIPTIHPAAQTDLIEAAKWYDERAGRGNAFLDAVQSAVAEIGQTPRRFARVPHPINGEVRRYLLHEFPYAVIYRMLGEQAAVVAVAHTNRKPGYWRRRGP